MRRRALLLLVPPLLAAAPAPDARRRLEALTAREEALSARMGANQQALVRLLGALETLRRDPPPALLVRPDRARDAARAAILLQAVTPELQRRARAFSAQSAELKRVRREAAEAGEALFAAESAAADGRAPSVPPPAPRPGDLLPPPAPERPVAAAPERLAVPVGGPPSHRFGEAAEDGRTRGWTWAPAPGAPVAAPADAVVEHAGPIRGRGLVVVLRLEGGWRVVLGGLGRVLPAAGAHVRAGERLGEAAGGRPLLLELRRGTEPVDPGPALAAR